MIIKFPNIKRNKTERTVHDDAEIWYSHGFSWETSVVAATIYNTIHKMERKIRRLEGKKVKNSPKRKLKGMHSDVVSLRKTSNEEE